MHEWTARLKATGLDQVELAKRLGVSVTAVKKGLWSANSRYTALVEALEIMTPEQRREWVAGRV